MEKQTFVIGEWYLYDGRYKAVIEITKSDSVCTSFKVFKTIELKNIDFERKHDYFLNEHLYYHCRKLSQKEEKLWKSRLL